MKIPFVISLIFLLACNQTIEQSNEESISDIDTTISVMKIDSSQDEKIDILNQDFLDFYSLFISGLSQKEINQFIHPIHGLYIINSTGAIPEIIKMRTEEESLKLLNSKISSIDNLLLTPTFEKLPKVVCDENIYDKVGCFTEEVNTLAESGIWNYSDLNDKEKQAIQFAVESVNITVINTFFFTFYFSKTDEGFKVTFIDIRTPCSA